jgi:hypothetical protein
MGKNRRKGLDTMVVGWEGGSVATVCTMDCIRAVGSFLDPKRTKIGLPDAPRNAAFRPTICSRVKVGIGTPARAP